MAYTRASKDMTNKVLEWFQTHPYVGSHPVVPRSELDDLAKTIEKIQEEYDREIEQRDCLIDELSKQNREQKDSIEYWRNSSGFFQKMDGQSSNEVRKTRIEILQLISEQRSDRIKLTDQAGKIRRLELLVGQSDSRVVRVKEDAATASKTLGDQTTQIKDLEAHNSACVAKVAKLKEDLKKRDLLIEQHSQHVINLGANNTLSTAKIVQLELDSISAAAIHEIEMDEQESVIKQLQADKATLEAENAELSEAWLASLCRPSPCSSS
jgi:hypothetical protein